MQNSPFIINLLEASVDIKNFLDQERLSGIKHAYYTWDAITNAPFVFDTEEIFRINVANYARHGVHFTHKIDVDETTTTHMNVSKMSIHVYRDEDQNAIRTNCANARGESVVDVFSMTLGFFPADCQVTIIEVTF